MLTTRCSVVICALVLLSVVYSAKFEGSSVETAEVWNDLARKELERAEAISPINHRAKNVILFLGDGMGVSTVTAGRILKGGEGSLLSFETFPYAAFSKTYSADQQVTDSASSATAFLSGVKTNDGLLGLDASVASGDCQASLRPAAQLMSILDWSIKEGKSAGVVTNTRITHATPGGAYANVPTRDWEGDSRMPADALAGGCRDIARQLVEDYPDLLQVIMGGGRQYFLPQNATDPTTGGPNAVYGRKDNRTLTEEWLQSQLKKGRKAHYVWNVHQLRSLDLNNTEYLMGLFAQNHLQYEKLRNDSAEPSLSEMTKIAIQILSKNPKGFFLLVEGGRIDHSHHDNIAYRALYETVEFSNVIDTAANLTSVQETLSITTADHSHGFVIAGYQQRGNNIFGIVDRENDTDGNSYTTLLYGSGPGYRYNQSQRLDVTNGQAGAARYVQEAAVPLTSGAHGGEDVAIYAKGPMAHLFHGVHEQNYIAHVMAYASCVGRYKTDGKCPPPSVNTVGSANLLSADVSSRRLLLLLTTVLSACGGYCYY